ncbi:hypothetical protein TNCV_2744981 [Trichonephila clavipes]|nr:hypothetical protein TNCV_2744981 [Trichonephila clavipes]
MCSNEETVQPVSNTQIAFKRCCQVKNCSDVLCKKQKYVQPVSEFDKGRIAAYRDCSVSYHSNVARGRDLVTVSRTWN